MFCSDGIIEAADTNGNIFGFDATAESILDGCNQDLSATALMDHLISTAQRFSGDSEQADDMTCVVVRVE